MSRSRTRKDFWSVISWILMGLFLIFLVYPIGKLLKEAVYTNGEFTLDAFRMFFSKSYYYDSIFHSVKIGVCVMVTSLLLGIPFAYFYSFYRLCLLYTSPSPRD